MRFCMVGKRCKVKRSFETSIKYCIMSRKKTTYYRWCVLFQTVSSQSKYLVVYLKKRPWPFSKYFPVQEDFQKAAPGSNHEGSLMTDLEIKVALYLLPTMGKKPIECIYLPFLKIWNVTLKFCICWTIAWLTCENTLVPWNCNVLVKATVH